MRHGEEREGPDGRLACGAVRVEKLEYASQAGQLECLLLSSGCHSFCLERLELFGRGAHIVERILPSIKQAEAMSVTLEIPAQHTEHPGGWVKGWLSLTEPGGD